MITGTTTVAGMFRFVAAVTDSGMPQQMAQADFAMIVFPNQNMLTIATGFLPPANLGQQYTATILVIGGTQPYHLSVASGTLPPGLTLDPATMTISGTPTAAGTFNFTLAVTDSSMPVQTAMRQFMLNVRNGMGGLQILTQFLPPGGVNMPYSATLLAVGGQTPYTWSLPTGSTLPPGLSLSASGMISGTPTMTGMFNFNVQVTDSSTPKQTAQAGLRMRVF
jgi:hypothetical protein